LRLPIDKMLYHLLGRPPGEKTRFYPKLIDL